MLSRSYSLRVRVIVSRDANIFRAEIDCELNADGMEGPCMVVDCSCKLLVWPRVQKHCQPDRRLQITKHCHCYHSLCSWRIHPSIGILLCTFDLPNIAAFQLGTAFWTLEPIPIRYWKWVVPPISRRNDLIKAHVVNTVRLIYVSSKNPLSLLIWIFVSKT
jgi:hypothetical protein